MAESIRADEGYFGQFGGAYVPEILHTTFEALNRAFTDARADPTFWAEYVALMRTYSCRPTPITFAENLTRHLGGARIYIQREDLNHTGAHKAAASPPREGADPSPRTPPAGTTGRRSRRGKAAPPGCLEPLAALAPTQQSPPEEDLHHSLGSRSDEASNEASHG